MLMSTLLGDAFFGFSWLQQGCTVDILLACDKVQIRIHSTCDTQDSELRKLHVTTEQPDRAKFSYRRHVVLRVQ